MHDVIGIVLLLGVASLLKLRLSSTVLVHYSTRIVPFSAVVSWILFTTSAVWLLLAGLIFVVRPR